MSLIHEPAPIPAVPIQPSASPFPLVHLLDIERADLAGQIVETDVMIAGVGEVFLVPSQWSVECSAEECPGNGRTVTLSSIDRNSSPSRTRRTTKGSGSCDGTPAAGTVGASR